MSSMGLLNFYLILIVVLVVVLFILVIILILFRDSFHAFCCCKSLETNEVAEPYGLRNPAFDDIEFSNRAGVLPAQRPFSVMEATESPPTYEEAVKQELFRFSLPIQFQTQRSNSISDIPVSNERSSSGELSEINASTLASSSTQRDASSSSPSTSQGAIRKRSSTAGSNGMLSTISEEDSDRDDRSLTVIIDNNIGVQTARLLENFESSVNIANGNELDKQSKC